MGGGLAVERDEDARQVGVVYQGRGLASRASGARELKERFVQVSSVHHSWKVELPCVK